MQKEVVIPYHFSTGSIICLETAVMNCHYSLRNSSEEHISRCSILFDDAVSTVSTRSLYLLLEQKDSFLSVETGKMCVYEEVVVAYLISWESITVVLTFKNRASYI